jgi:hypothetical protein
MSKAPIEENRTLLAKADLILADLISDGGYLLAEQARKFLKIAIDESAILSMSFVETIKSHTKLIERIGLTTPMLVPGYEGTALTEADRTKPVTDKPTITTHLYKGEIQLTDETLEDNIEGGNLKTTIMNLIGERVGLDMSDILLNGDTASLTPRYSLFDGIRKLATANVVAAGGVPLDKATFKSMMKTLPSQFMRDKRKMKFLTSVDAEIDYRDSLADRATALGDVFLNEDRRAAYNGIEVVPDATFPENLGGGTNETEVIFSDPKNFRVGIWRQVKMETDRDIRRGILFTVVSTRFGFIYEESDAVVKATGVTVS